MNYLVSEELIYESKLFLLVRFLRAEANYAIRMQSRQTFGLVHSQELVWIYDLVIYCYGVLGHET